MNVSKYIVLVTGEYDLPSAIIFPGHITHSHIAKLLCGQDYLEKIISAGFVKVETNTKGDCIIIPYGSSDSLKKESRLEDECTLKQALGISWF